MDSWLKKLHDNVNKRTGDDVEAAVKTDANMAFAYVLGTSALLLFFLLNNYHKYTPPSVYYFNHERSRKFSED